MSLSIFFMLMILSFMNDIEWLEIGSKNFQSENYLTRRVA